MPALADHHIDAVDGWLAAAPLYEPPHQYRPWGRVRKPLIVRDPNKKERFARGKGQLGCDQDISDVELKNKGLSRNGMPLERVPKEPCLVHILAKGIQSMLVASAFELHESFKGGPYGSWLRYHSKAVIAPDSSAGLAKLPAQILRLFGFPRSEGQVSRNYRCPLVRLHPTRRTRAKQGKERSMLLHVPYPDNITRSSVADRLGLKDSKDAFASGALPNLCVGI